MSTADYGSTDLKDLRRLRHLVGGHRRGRDPIHPTALEPPHRSQGEQFLGVDARARVRGIWKVSQQVARRVGLGKYIVGGGWMLLLLRRSSEVTF